MSTPAAAQSAVADATGVLVTGLLAFAVTAGTAGMIAVGLALGRHHARVSEDAMRLALGLTRGQRVLALALPLTVSGLIAAPMAVAIAGAASPLTPNGSIAQLEPAPGVEANVAFLAVGGAHGDRDLARPVGRYGLAPGGTSEGQSSRPAR